MGSDRPPLVKSIRAKTTLVATLATFVAMVVVVAVVGFGTQYLFKSMLADNMMALLDKAQGYVEAGDYNAAMANAGSGLLQIIDADGNVVASSANGEGLAPIVDPDDDGQDDGKTDKVEVSKDDLKRRNTSSSTTPGTTSTDVPESSALAGSPSGSRSSGTSSSKQGSAKGTSKPSSGSGASSSADTKSDSSSKNSSSKSSSSKSSSSKSSSSKSSGSTSSSSKDGDEPKDSSPSGSDASGASAARDAGKADMSDDAATAQTPKERPGSAEAPSDGSGASQPQERPNVSSGADTEQGQQPASPTARKNSMRGAAAPQSQGNVEPQTLPDAMGSQSQSAQSSHATDEDTCLSRAASRAGSGFVSVAHAATSSADGALSGSETADDARAETDADADADADAGADASADDASAASEAYVDASSVLGDDGPYLVMDRLVESPDGTVTLAAMTSLAPAIRSAQGSAQVLALVLLVLLVAVALFAWYLSARTLRPVNEMSAQAAAITTSDLAARVDVPVGDRDLSHLARTLNDLLARIEASVDEQKRFMSDASHELKSPVAATRIMLETLRDYPETLDKAQVVNDLSAENERISHVVGDMLMLARQDENRMHVEKLPVDLFDMLREEAVALGKRSDVEIDVSDVEPVICAADAELLGHAVRNLLDNAARYARTRVKLSCSLEDGRVHIVVSDDGPGIAPEDRERVFDRFVRLEDSRSRKQGSTGLGLAVVRSIVERHGGTVRFEDGELSGATARIVIDEGL